MTDARTRAPSAAWAAVRPGLAAGRASPCSAPDEAVAFLARLDLRFPDVHEPMAVLYGSTAVDALFERAVRLALAAAAERPAELRRLDHEREITPAGSSASRPSATSPTSTASPARWPACASGCPTCASSASPTCT